MLWVNFTSHAPFFTGVWINGLIILAKLESDTIHVLKRKLAMISDRAKQRRQELLRKIKNSPNGLHHILSDENVVDSLREDAREYGTSAVIPAEILEDYLRFAEMAHNHPTRLGAAGGPPQPPVVCSIGGFKRQ